jgi:multiple sugar transport system permease protein
LQEWLPVANIDEDFVQVATVRTGVPAEGGESPHRALPGPRRKMHRDTVPIRALATPSVVVLGLIGAYPLVYAVWQSLRNGSLTSSGSFVGLANYSAVLSSSNFWSCFKFTVIFTLAAVIGSYVVGLALALAFQAGFPGAGIVKPLLLLPWVVPVVVSMTSWGWLIGTPQGLGDQVTHALGLGDVGFLATPTLAIISVCTVKIWESFPFMFLVLSAGLDTVDPALYEAARVDGASWWSSVRHISLPMLRTISVMSWILMAIFSVNDFSTIWLLTGGGPLGATQSLVVYSYQLVFQEFQTGQGVAVAIFTTLATALLAIVLFRFINAASTRRRRVAAQ